MCEEEQFHKLERRVGAVEDRLTNVGGVVVTNIVTVGNGAAK